MKNILLSSLSYEGCYGGVENSLRYLSKSYKNSGQNVIVLASSSSYKNFQRIGRDNGVTLIRFRRNFVTNKYLNIVLFPLFIVDILWALSMIKLKYPIHKSICRNQFICFFVNLFFGSKNVYLAPGFSHRQSAKENMTNEGIALTLRRKLHMFFDYAALKFSSSVFVFSNNMVEQAEELALNFTSKGLEKKISITKPGVDKSVFYPVIRNDKCTLKLSLGLPEDKMILLCLGRCVKAKGFDLALQAIVGNEHCHLVIVGDGPELDNLQREASFLNISQRVSFFGARNDVSTFYQASDYFFMSSTYEPLGQTILEAISCALPVIAFSSTQVMTATQELMGTKGVMYIDNNDFDIMREGLALLPLPLSNEYDSLSKSALELSGLFDWDLLAKELI